MILVNNSSFGLTVQKKICDIYSVPMSDWANKQFESSYNSKYNDIEPLIKKIFSEIASIPIKCLSYKKDNQPGSTIIPHNFFLKNGKTLSIKTSIKGNNAKIAPQVVGQSGYDSLNYHFGHLVKNKIKSQLDIKELIWNRLDEMLPILVDYLFLSDILVWVYINKGKYDYKIVYRAEKPDIKWEKSKISFSKSNILEWKESLSIKYDNLSIAEAQIHKNRNYKFRFNFSNLLTLLNKREKNNETLGMSAEKAICDMFALDKPSHIEERANESIILQISDSIKNAFEFLPKPIEYVGTEKGETGGTSKSPYDFILEGNKTLSLKTNFGDMVCPPEVGQPSIKTFIRHFGNLIDNIDDFNQQDFKELCFSDTAELLNVYMDFLLDCDFLLWIYKDKSAFDFKVICKTNSKFTFNQKDFSFTRDLDNWNESNTVKYKGKKIGEFQVHSKRNSLKFRFDMKNLIDLLN